ncbi:MAG: PEGA domain-containing protein [Planctomycetes bacterium]|nr:PEGA domain-containing protein [Planctomycetota bacterium]
MSGRRSKTMRAFAAVLTVAGGALVFSGCTSRGMTITSLPEGAEVSINRRVVGTTPVRVNYTHYGDYRIEVRKDKHDVLVRQEKLRPPPYGYDPLAFFADNVVPARLNDEVYLHYVLKPVDEKKFDADTLVGRAVAARDGKVSVPESDREVQVAWENPRKEAPPTGIGEPKAAAVVPLAEGPAAAPELDVAPKGETIKPATIDETRPKSQTIAEDLGLDKGEKDDKEKKEGTEKPKRMRRTPKGEVYIYDEEPIEDPEKK